MTPASEPPPAGAASTALLTVDLDAIVANWRALDALSPGAETAAVVKANAYGLGLGPVARALHAAGARVFFVAQAPEGAALRSILGPGPAIYVFNGFMPADLEIFVASDLRPALSTPQQAAAFAAAAPAFPARPRAALHIDTGINRLGLTGAELKALAAAPPRDIEVDLIVSHLARADEPDTDRNVRQRAVLLGGLDLARRIAPDARLSLAATGGILLGHAFHFDLVRPGIGLYGCLPFADARPVVSLRAPFLQIRDVVRGESVGYGGDWTAPRHSRIGVLPVGYADGFFRALAGASVFVKGRAAPIVGRVSMDMITVDVTDLPRPAPGDEAEIIGPEQSVDALAAHAGTIGYEILTALGPRYRRRYLGGPRGAGEGAAH